MDLATGYSDMALVSSRSLEKLKYLFDVYWAHLHGDSGAVRFDMEFNKNSFVGFLMDREIKSWSISACRRGKKGSVEKNHCSSKDLLDGLLKPENRRRSGVRLHGWCRKAVTYLTSCREASQLRL